VTAPASARRRALAAGLVVGLASGAGAFAGCEITAPTAAAAAPAPKVAAPASDPAGSSPGYVLMDLPAIQKAVRGKSRPVLVHFWASWCGPCLQELPTIDKLARDLKTRGIDLISLSLDDPARAGERVVRLLTLKAPTLTRNIVHVSDPDAFINAIDPTWEGAIPALFAYDGKGQLRGRLIGEASPQELDGLIARIAPR
jgi:thiol-disulfide isomerase/thioredoxin